MEPSPRAYEPIRLSPLSNRTESNQQSTSDTDQPFQRQSWAIERPTDYHVLNPKDEDLGKESQDEEAPNAKGLGLVDVHDLPRGIKRKPLGARTNSEISQKSSKSPLSPESSYGLLSQTSTALDSPRKPKKSDSRELFPEGARSEYLQSEFDRTTRSEEQPSYSTTNLGLACPTDGDILSLRSWYTIPIMTLATYSTVFSGILLGIAVSKPRWGEQIGTDGHMPYATATLLSTLVSKTIELSFVTVFVALLGQILSRRAVPSRKKTMKTSGISIADMTMRSWIVAPGTLFTQWTAIRYAAVNILGLIALVAAVAATFYTTAAEALVSPKLKLGPMEHKVLAGGVSAQFANAPYLANHCQTPILPSTDPDYGGTTCLQIEYAGLGFHNFQSYMTNWTTEAGSGNTTAAFSGRPLPFATLFDNTTVSGEWLASPGNVTTDSKTHRRLVHNITMAMPHANVFNAVRDPVNKILQPEDLQGLGEYSVWASVPAPSINVLCVGLSKDELEPLISNDTSQPPKATAVDDLFQFSETQPAPFFPLIPESFNTVVNFTNNWGPNSVYLLATPSPDIKTNDNVLCSLKATQYPACTTQYHVAQAGGELSVHCDGHMNNSMPYNHYRSDANAGVWEPNWKDIGSEWIKAVALTQGVSNSNASIARLITQMIPPFDNETNHASLKESIPTIGEALGVLAGCTLLLASRDAPFVHFWNYSDASYLKTPQRQSFDALIQYKDYASGGTQTWQGIFYLVLVAVFLLNCFALAYLGWRFFSEGQITDYTEPANLFALAINSPPSRSMRGTCGAGPGGEVMGKKWHVGMDAVNPHQLEEDDEEASLSGMMHPHFYFKCPDDETSGLSKSGTPKRRKMKSRPPSMQSLLTAGSPVKRCESPAVKQYEILTGA